MLLRRMSFWLGLGLTFSACQLPEQGADWVLVNGKIYTLTDQGAMVAALAIRDDRIVFAGDSQAVRAYMGPATCVWDLSGSTVLPGFTDGHIHPVAGASYLLDCDLTGLKDAGDIRKVILDFAEGHPNKTWIVGNGFWLPAIEGGMPTRETLDLLVPDRPAFIRSADGHSAWVNSRALELAGIHKNTPQPVNGVIEKDPFTGEPIGTLRESASALVSRLIPPLSTDERVGALENAIQIANSHGVTSWVHASVTKEDIEAYLEVEKRGKLTLYPTLSILADIRQGSKAVLAVDSLYRLYQPRSSRIRMNSTKIFIDGVIEGKTAALLEPYVNETHSGLAYQDPEIYQAMIAAFEEKGFQVHVHACGDLGVRMTLDAYAYAREKNGIGDHRHHIVHMQLVDPKDIGRFAELDVIANFQPLWATLEDTYISELTLPVLGPERSEWVYPLGAVAKTGGTIAHGSDWPVTTLNPFHAIQVAVTRRGPDTLDREPWAPHHLVSVYDAVAGYTRGGAYLQFGENDYGTLEVGKKANLMVLDRDPFTIPVTNIHQTKVMRTLWNGQVVYEAPDE